MLLSRFQMPASYGKSRVLWIRMYQPMDYLEACLARLLPTKRCLQPLVAYPDAIPTPMRPLISRELQPLATVQGSWISTGSGDP